MSEIASYLGCPSVVTAPPGGVCSLCMLTLPSLPTALSASRLMFLLEPLAANTGERGVRDELSSKQVEAESMLCCCPSWASCLHNPWHHPITWLLNSTSELPPEPEEEEDLEAGDEKVRSVRQGGIGLAAGGLQMLLFFVSL